MAEQKQSDNATYINVLSWNMQGKSNSWDKIPEFLDKANIDVACLQECGDLTKLIGKPQQKEIEYPYTYPRKDITTKFGTLVFGEIKSKNVMILIRGCHSRKTPGTRFTPGNQLQKKWNLLENSCVYMSKKCKISLKFSFDFVNRCTASLG